jgi:hypothetical protein
VDNGPIQVFRLNYPKRMAVRPANAVFRFVLERSQIVLCRLCVLCLCFWCACSGVCFVCVRQRIEKIVNG